MSFFNNKRGSNFRENQKCIRGMKIKGIKGIKDMKLQKF